MEVDKNSPTYPCITHESRQSKDYEGHYTVESNNSGIPLRLEIASRIMAAVYSNPSSDMNPSLRNITIKQTAFDCLDAADQLIDAHNKSCEGEK